MSDAALRAHRRETWRGAAILLVTSVIWGVAFVPQAKTVAHMGPLYATGIRFLLAIPFAGLLAVTFGGRSGERPKLRDVVVLGTLLAVAFWFQTAATKVGPVSRVAFITSLYAILTPLLAPLFGVARPRALHVAGAVTALFGLSLLVGLVGGAPSGPPLGAGDGLTLGHAALSACHLLIVARIASRADPLWLNFGQIVVVAVLVLPVAVLLEDAPPLTVFDGATIASFVYLSAISSSLAFLLQIFGQRLASAPVASVIMILEAPVGAGLALVVLDEEMGALAALGALVMLGGVLTSVKGDLDAARAPRAP